MSRALRALSSAYVERRAKLAQGAALSGAGKRAAFALFYGPLHFLLIRHIVQNLPGAIHRVHSLIDLGCGTGASGAAWASSFAQADAHQSSPRVIGIDRHPWPVGEAVATYRAFGLSGTALRGDIAKAKLPVDPAAFLAAFTLNELADSDRDAVLKRLVERSSRGDRVLVVEPLAGSAAPWWTRWCDIVERAGGRADEWRVRLDLPPIVAKLDRAAGLNHREIIGRSLWLPGERRVRSERCQHRETE